MFPISLAPKCVFKAFSPRTRGCSFSLVFIGLSPYVFPAHAGMFLLAQAYQDYTAGFPRARGDVPMDAITLASRVRFSPRTRGCSRVNFTYHGPTPFSPRTRGCSLDEQPIQLAREVFPAHAGMFRLGHTFVQFLHGFPRARGDVPSRWSERQKGKPFSPRTRGCSVGFQLPRKATTVFPAHAGMFPTGNTVTSGWNSFPRARGDVPAQALDLALWQRFSPRTRGCSDHADVLHAAACGFPRARGDVPGCLSS